MSRLRLIETFGRDRAAPLMVAKVYRDSAVDEYVVRFYKNGTEYKPRADYHTSDKQDALDTADFHVNLAHQGASA